MLCAADFGCSSSRGVTLLALAVSSLVVTQLLCTRRGSAFILVVSRQLSFFLALIAALSCTNVAYASILLSTTLVFAVLSSGSTSSTSAQSGNVTLPLAVSTVGLMASSLTSHICGAFISVELVSLSMLLLMSGGAKASSRAPILTYYWVSAICAMSFTLICAACSTQVPHVEFGVVGAAFSALGTFMVGAKLGALPAGLWAVWFYESLNPATLAAYLGIIYPTLVLTILGMVVLASKALILGHTIATLVVLCSAMSVLALLSSKHTSSRLLSSLLVTLTTSTFILMLVAVALS